MYNQIKEKLIKLRSIFQETILQLKDGIYNHPYS